MACVPPQSDGVYLGRGARNPECVVPGAPGGSAANGGVGPLTRDLTLDSATLRSPDVEYLVPDVMVPCTEPEHLPLACAGQAENTRYAASGGNLLHAIIHAPEGNAPLRALAENTLAWLTRRQH